MPKKAIDPSERWYDDREVSDYIHNAVIACVRWDRHKETLPKRATSLRNFANGLVLSLRDVLSEDNHGNTVEQVINDHELVVALLAAAEVLLVTNEDKTHQDVASREIEKGKLKTITGGKRRGAYKKRSPEYKARKTLLQRERRAARRIPFVVNTQRDDLSLERIAPEPINA